MNYILILFLFTITYEVSIGHMLSKCEINNDDDCEKVLYQKVIREVATTGIPDANVPVIDPMRITNIETTLPNSVRLNLTDGVATGIKDCVFIKLKSYLVKPLRTELNMTCNIDIHGWFKIMFPNELMKQIGGADMYRETIEGTGIGNIFMRNLNIYIEIPYDFEYSNNNIYVICKEIQLRHNARDAIEFVLEDFDLGHVANNAKIVEYLRKYSADLIPPYAVIENIKIFYQKFLDNYLSKIPASEYITNELTHFVKQ